MMISSRARILRAGRAALVAASLAVAGPALAAEDQPGAEVSIDNFAFTPAEITVKPGTVVTFVNRDDIPHLVVGAGFRSKALDTDDRFSYAFEKPGDYDYFCGLHPHMKGKVVVAP